MYEQITQQFVTEAQKLAQPFNQVRDLTIKNLDRVAHFQVKAVKAYAELGLAELKEGAAIQNPEQLQEYLTHATEKAERFGNRVTEDGRALMAMGEEYVKQVQKIAEQQLGEWNKTIAA